MRRLILIEGLPGTGKTTATQRLSEHLVSKGESVVTLFEGDDQSPCDFYETAGVPIADFDIHCTQYPEVMDAIRGSFLRTRNYVYMRLDKCPDFVADTFRKWDMGDEINQQIGVAQYVPCVLERIDYWVAANLDNKDTFIVDSGFLQNPINELLFRMASDDEVRSFIQSISERFRPLNPLCLYLKRESAETALSFAKKAKGPGWSTRVDAMLRKVGYPNLFEHRFELELDLLSCIPHAICLVSGYDWTDVERQIQQLF